jgi:hypothetical protein
MFLPAEKAKILDTLYSLGMRGTGSDDVMVSNLIIPERYTALLTPLEKPGTAYQGPLYRLTLWGLVALLAFPALGIAHAAAVRIRFGKSLRVSQRTDAEGKVRQGLLCFLSIQYSLCPNAIP